MTFQTFKNRFLAIALFLMATVSINAQESVPMQALVGQSLSKIEQSSPESILNCVAELKRIDAMFPDSIQPKYYMALQSLNYAVTYPRAEQTENLLTETEQTIERMEKMQNADQSDICTLRGFLYMVRIVQNPAQNGQRYYLTVMQNYEKALKLNPNNALAQQLQQKFQEGMNQAMKSNY
ncbi:MAG: hypothetical protein IKW98_04775 [Prevotella sp.]|nr:hypothetical protein [Prevotella sp.]